METYLPYRMITKATMDLRILQKKYIVADTAHEIKMGIYGM